MSALGKSDVTYTLVKKTVQESSYRSFHWTLAYGDGALTYPSNGVPLDASKLGCPNQILSFSIWDPSFADGYVYKFDPGHVSLRLYVSGAHAHTLNLKNAAVADGASARVNAGTNLLGANTGSDITIAGAGANGGIANSTAVVLAEIATSVAPAATTLHVQVIGW